MDVISPEPDTGPDPYAPLRSLADGWRAHAHDLTTRSDEQSQRAGALNLIPWRDRSRFDPSPEELTLYAQANKLTAATMMKAARDLDAAIERAVHRTGAPS